MHIRQYIYTSFSATMVAALSMLLCYGPLPAAPGDGISVVLTADTEGQVEPCRDCPGQPSLGGLARRATLIAQLRQAHPSLLLVDAGNTLFGAESLESQGRVIVAAYQALGYDALNLSYRDFRRGKAATLALLQDAPFAVLSANLLDADTGHPLVQSYVIKQVAHERIALIGLTQSPAGLAYLPHLKEQLTGIRIQPPLEALSQWLPQAQAESDRIILLYYGTLAGLQPIREQFGHALAAILVGGSRPEEIPADAEPPVVSTSARGRHVAHLRLPSPGGGSKGEVTQLAIEPTTTPDDTIATLMNQAMGGGASGALSERGHPELARPPERSTAGETAEQQIQDPKGRGQQRQEEVRSQTPPSLPESGVQTPEQAMTESTAEPAARQPQEEQLPADDPRMDIVISRGTIKAVLAKEVTALSEPITPTDTFPEDAKAIYLVLKSELATTALVYASWVPMTVEGPKPHLWDTPTLALRPGQWGNIRLKAPPGGFSPGEYRVKIFVDHEPTEALPFTIVPLLPPAPSVAPSDVPRGFNIALAALGGRVVQATSQLNGTTWAAANLTDGMAFTPDNIPVGPGATRRICDPSCGWSSRDKTLPQDIVLAFHRGREARITAVVIDTTTYSAAVEGKVDNLPKHVEVWASTTSVPSGFTKLAGARLQPRAAQYLISLPPTQAQYVKVRFLSNHGGDATTAAEVRVIEANDGPASILWDVPKNLALPSLGGAVVGFRSAAPDTKVGQLVDDSPAGEGWRSADDRLPQVFVFAFHGDQVALIDRIVLQPTTSHHSSTWPRRITVSVSDESPLEGFHEVGQFTLRQEAREQAFPIGRRARFLRLRILENFGGHYTSLGKLKVIEGAAERYESVLRTTPEAIVTPPKAGPAGAIASAGVLQESEPNGTPAEANALEVGRTTRGVIDPKGETDYFKLSVPGSASTVLTLEFLGWPHIRTSVTLIDPLGARLKRFDPGTVPSQQARFSWAVWPGEHLVQVTEPPISMVLIWDTSGSMRGSTDDLRRAVESYLDQVQPSERLNLIRFSTPGRHKLQDVEVLLPGFTSDRARLHAATAGKFFADGDTPLYDAISKGIELLEGVEGNRAIVVMTDGVDSHRGLSHSGFWGRLQAKRIRLYTIGLGFDLQTYLPKVASTGERILAHAAIATNGRFFFARTAEELQGLYQQIADELRTVSIYDVRPTLSRGPGSLDVVATGERIPQLAPPQLVLMLDASGSMKEKVKGRRKIDIAKGALVQFIKGLPDGLPVAMRVFGHRIREGQPGDCQDSELVVPLAPLDKPRLLRKVLAIQALGTTPLADSIRQLAGDFGTAPGEKWVLLITDALEWCGGNPGAEVSGLRAKGFNVKLLIVGFALDHEAAERELRQLGDRFIHAKDGEALRGAIEQALAVPYDVLDAAGSRVASGLTGQGAIAVPEGVYTVVVRAAGKPITIADVRITHDQFTRVELKKEGQEVGTQVLGPVQKHEAPWAAAARTVPPSPRRK